MSTSVERALEAPVRRFGPYPAYKDSGVQWLDRIPVHWEMRQLRRLLRSIEQGWSPTADDRPASEYEWAVIKLSAIHAGSFNDTEHKALPAGLKALPALEIRKGDVLLTRANTPDRVGDACLVTQTRERLMLSDLVYRLGVEDASIDRRFLVYVLLSLAGRHQIKVDAHGSNMTMAKVSQGHIKSWVAFVPPRPEQHAITVFLSHETARIDALIAKKGRLIELLQEKWTALIADAISQASVSTEVRLGYYVDLLPGFAFPSTDFSHNPDDVRLLRGVNISPGSLRWDEVVNWPRHDLARFSRYRLQNGDIVLGMDRPWIGSGLRVSLVTVNDLPALLLQRVARLRAKHGLTQQFLRLILEGPQFRSYFEPILTGISVPHISPDQIASFRFKLPSMSTQAAICKNLEPDIVEIKKLSETLANSVDYLNELRTALISAAVTGKIDVRGEVA